MKKETGDCKTIVDVTDVREDRVLRSVGRRESRQRIRNQKTMDRARK